MTYKILTTKSIKGETQEHIIKDNGNGNFTSFPLDETNPNYEEYQAWIDAGNTPEPADTPEEAE